MKSIMKKFCAKSLVISIFILITIIPWFIKSFIYVNFFILYVLFKKLLRMMYEYKQLFTENLISKSSKSEVMLRVYSYIFLLIFLYMYNLVRIYLIRNKLIYNSIFEMLNYQFSSSYFSSNNVTAITAFLMIYL